MKSVLGLMVASAQLRRVLAGVAIDSLGTGMFLGTSALFLRYVAGLTPRQISIGLAIAGAAAVATAMAWGNVGGRIGARRTIVGISLWRAVAYLAYAFVHGEWHFYAVALGLGLADRAAGPLFQVLVGECVDPGQRARGMGALRIVRNTGFVVGSSLASLFVGTGGYSVLRWLIMANAGSFLVMVVVLNFFVDVGEQPRAVAVPDDAARARGRYGRRYTILTGLNGVLFVHTNILGLAIPLWFTSIGHLSPGWIPLLMGINMVGAVIGQALVPGLLTGTQNCGRALSAGFACLAGCCLMLAISAFASGEVPVVCCGVASVILLTACEVLQLSAGWELAELWADPSDRSRYLSFFGMGQSACLVFGPLLIGSVVLPLGLRGWSGAASVFIAGAFASLALVGSTQGPRRSRPA